MANEEFSLRTKADPAIYDVAVFGKALEILETLGRRRPTGLTEIALSTGASKPSSFQILRTLETRDFVVKDPTTRKYRPGRRLAALASSRTLRNSSGCGSGALRTMTKKRGRGAMDRSRPSTARAVALLGP